MRVGLNWSLQLGQMFRRRVPLTCHLREICLLLSGAQVNREQDSLRPGADLPSNGDQNINESTSNGYAKKEKQIPKQKRTLRSLKDFRLEPIFFSWYRDDKNSLFRVILTEFGIKNDVDRFIKLLYSAAEIIRHLDQDETDFNNRLHYFHHQYCKDYLHETQPSLEKFDDYLFRCAMKVWPRALDKTHEYSKQICLKLTCHLRFLLFAPYDY